MDFSGGAFGEGPLVDVLMIGGSVLIAVGKVEVIAVMVTIEGAVLIAACGVEPTVVVLLMEVASLIVVC